MISFKEIYRRLEMMSRQNKSRVEFSKGTNGDSCPVISVSVVFPSKTFIQNIVLESSLVSLKQTGRYILSCRTKDLDTNQCYTSFDYCDFNEDQINKIKECFSKIISNAVA